MLNGHGPGQQVPHTLVSNNDCDDEAVDTDHTSHNHRDDALHHELGLRLAHDLDTHSTFRSSVGSPQVCSTGQGHNRT